MNMPAGDAVNPTEEFKLELQNDLEQSRRAQKEIALMLELAQRNAQITGHLQQIQMQFDIMPRNDIRAAYNAALDIQQRMLVMRGQLEKLQSEHTAIKRHVELLEKTLPLLGSVGKSGGPGGKTSSGTAMLEIIISGQEAERLRLSRQMHDGPAQALSNFIVQADIVGRLFELDPNRAKEELSNLKNAALSTFKKVRSFIFDLRPMMLDDLGFIPTIRRYADSMREQTGVEVNVNVKGQERRIESYLEVMIFRAIQELVGNAIKHNQDMPGKLQINIQMMIEEVFIKVSVSDNGKGFDAQGLANATGLGLKLIRERVEMVGGYVEIDSAAGSGCKISYQVPCAPPENQ
jgi:two-component system sensor histidine kinase DegS